MAPHYPDKIQAIIDKGMAFEKVQISHESEFVPVQKMLDTEGCFIYCTNVRLIKRGPGWAEKVKPLKDGPRYWNI